MNILIYIVSSYLVYYFIIGCLNFDSYKEKQNAVSLGLASPFVLPIILGAILISTFMRFGEYVGSKFK